MAGYGSQDWLVVHAQWRNLYVIDTCKHGASLREEWATNQLLVGARTLHVERFFCFAIDGLHEMPDVPGDNDPVQVKGDLFGPFASGEQVITVHGTLTITRAEILEGFIRGT